MGVRPHPHQLTVSVPPVLRAHSVHTATPLELTPPLEAADRPDTPVAPPAPGLHRHGRRLLYRHARPRPHLAVQLADKETEEEEEYCQDDGEDRQGGEEGVSHQEVSALVEAAQDTEAAEAGVVEDPGEEELGLGGDQPHDQQEGGDQAQQGDHQQGPQRQHGQSSWSLRHDEHHHPAHTHHQVQHHLDDHCDVDEAGEVEAFSLFDGEHSV